MDNTFNEFAQKEKEREHMGKIIVMTVGILSFVSTALNLAVKIDPLSIISNITLTILFMRGFDWVRVLFASVLAWNSVWLIFSFCCLLFTNMKWWVMIIYIITIIYSVTASALLFASRSVKEYLYVKRNG